MGRGKTEGVAPPVNPVPPDPWGNDDGIGRPIYGDPTPEPILGSEATWGEEPAEVAAARVAKWDDVFLRSDGREIVWVNDRGIPGIQPVVREIDQPTLRGLLNQRRVVFRVKTMGEDGRWTARKVPPPSALVERIITTVPGAEWRLLEGVAHAPYMLADGSIITESGFRDGLWLSRSGAVDLSRVPPVAALQPHGYDQEEAKDAAQAIMFDLMGIEWASDADRSSAFAYFLTLISRPAYRLCPMFLFTAPLPGSGKDLVAKCMEAAAYGEEAMRVTPPPGRKDDASSELDKRIGAAMLAGESTIVVGDMRCLLSPTLYSLTTERRPQGFRVLGISEAIPVPRNLVLVGIGNNPEIGPDIIRRAVSVRIVPRTAKPSERKFDVSEEALIDRYRQNRAAYICAAVNIIRGAMLNPPSGLLPCSFAGWARMVQAACVYAGLPDPLASREGLKRRVTSDDAPSVLAPLVAAWWTYRGHLSVTATQACAALDLPAEDLAAAAYKDALRAIAPKLTPQALGKLLTGAEDASFDVQESDGSVVLLRIHATTRGGVAYYALQRA